MIRFLPASRPARSGLTLVVGLACLAVTLGPTLRWLADPALFDDDLIRVGGSRRYPLGVAMFRPFNEHLAPLFEVIGWLAWRGSGRDVLAVAAAYRAASIGSFLACFAAVGFWARAESRSTSVAVAALIWFSLSSVSAETVLWYSASSFEWAAASAAMACGCASMAARSDGRLGQLAWGIGAAIFSACAPAFSAVGLPAGPLASLRIAIGRAELSGSGSGPDRGFSRLVLAAMPMVGLALFLGLVAAMRHTSAIGQSLDRDFEPVAATWAALRAPAFVLIPGWLGVESWSRTMPDPIAAVATLALLAVLGAIGLARPGRRGLIWVGLGWVAASYLLAYATRARPGDRWVFDVPRYHLFPRIGLAVATAGALATWLGRLDARPATTRWSALLGLATIWWALHAGGMERAAGRFRFPDQPERLAAALRLEADCARHRISLDQAARCLDPIRTDWFPRALIFHPFLYLFDDEVRPLHDPRTDRDARALIVSDLAPDDRERIFGGSFASEDALPPGSPPSAGPMNLVGSGSTRRGDVVSTYREYEVDPTLPTPKGLACDVDPRASGPAEVWWAGTRKDWSPSRSIETSLIAGPGVIRLDRLAHWGVSRPERIRIVRRGAGARRGEIAIRPVDGP